MKIDHVTYQLPSGALSDENIAHTHNFLWELGFHPVPVNEPKGSQPISEARLRWFEDDDGLQLHLIETPVGIAPVPLGLGHFAIDVSKSRYEHAQNSPWCTRDSTETSGRLWLEHPNGLRIEVRCPMMQSVGEPIPERRTMWAHPLPSARAEIIEPMEEKLDKATVTIDGEPVPLAGPITIQYADPPRTPVGYYQRSDIPPEIWDHFQELEKALRVYEERNKVHNDNWAQFGWKGCLFRIKERVERLWDGTWEREEIQTDEAVDDAIDLINFAVFYIRCVEEQNRGGDWRL